MFTLTALEIFLFEGTLLLSLAQRGTGSKMVNVSVKNQKNTESLLKLPENWLSYKLRMI